MPKPLSVNMYSLNSSTRSVLLLFKNETIKSSFAMCLPARYPNKRFRNPQNLLFGDKVSTVKCLIVEI